MNKRRGTRRPAPQRPEHGLVCACGATGGPAEGARVQLIEDGMVHMSDGSSFLTLQAFVDWADAKRAVRDASAGQ